MSIWSRRVSQTSLHPCIESILQRSLADLFSHKKSLSLAMNKLCTFSQNVEYGTFEVKLAPEFQHQPVCDSVTKTHTQTSTHEFVGISAGSLVLSKTDTTRPEDLGEF